jgi:hypothetical protein
VGVHQVVAAVAVGVVADKTLGDWMLRSWRKSKSEKHFSGGTKQ